MAKMIKSAEAILANLSDNDRQKLAAGDQATKSKVGKILRQQVKDDFKYFDKLDVKNAMAATASTWQRASNQIEKAVGREVYGNKWDSVLQSRIKNKARAKYGDNWKEILEKKSQATKDKRAAQRKRQKDQPKGKTPWYDAKNRERRQRKRARENPVAARHGDYKDRR